MVNAHADSESIRQVTVVAETLVADKLVADTLVVEKYHYCRFLVTNIFVNISIDVKSG